MKCPKSASKHSKRPNRSAFNHVKFHYATALIVLSFCTLSAQNNTTISGNYLWTAKKLIRVDSTSSFPLSISFLPLSPDTLRFHDVFKQEGALIGAYRKIETKDIGRTGLMAIEDYEDEKMLQIQGLLHQKLINDLEYSALIDLVQNSKSQSLDAFREIGKDRPTVFNPFYINGQFQLVFEVEIQNHGNEVLELSNTFSISNHKGSTHHAFKVDEFMDYYKDRPVPHIFNDDLRAYRQILKSTYFPDILYVAPESRTKKLIAFPPSILESDTLEIFLYGNRSAVTFEAKIEQRLEELSFHFSNFNHLFRHGSFYFKESQLLMLSTSFPIYREGDQILVNHENLDQKTDLLIVGLIGQEIYFLRLSNLVFSEYLAKSDENNKVLEGNLKKLKFEE